MCKALLATLLLLSLGLSAAAQKNPKADDLLKTAKAKALDDHKSIFLEFDASWCDACHQLDAFLNLPEVAAIFDKYFVVVTLTFGEGAAGHPDWDTPGADSQIEKYGGITSSGDTTLPFVAILDAKARLLANSNRPVKNPAAKSSIGFPTEPDDIKAFLSMLIKGAPDLTEDEAHKLQAALQKAATL
jgi:Thioredoxin-like